MQKEEEEEEKKRRRRVKKKCLALQSLRLPFGHISKKAKTNCTSCECGKRDTQATQKEGRREREREKGGREARRKQLADRRRHKTRRRQETTNGNAISSSSSQSQSSIDIGSSNVVFCLYPSPATNLSPPLLLNVWQALLLLHWSSAACQTS